MLSNIEKVLENLCIKEYIYTSLSNNNIYNLMFGFRQQYSTSYGLTNITIRKALDDGTANHS